MAKKVKTAARSLPVPQSDTEAREAIREIGDLSREALRLQAAMNDQIAALQESYGADVAPLNERARALTDGLQIFCEANRDRLTRGGKVKFFDFATGKVSWRLKPAKVSLRKVEDVIERIKAAGLAQRFLRTKEEINKEAMLEDRAAASAIAGVTIGSDGEDFIVEPFETDLQEAG